VQYSVSVRFSSDGQLEVIGDQIAISIKSQRERGRANQGAVEKAGGIFWSKPRAGQDSFRSYFTEKDSRGVVKVMIDYVNSHLFENGILCNWQSDEGMRGL